MIHYLLLLRPVTFQHEPPPPPPSALYHYPHYYQQQHPKVNPTKPQKPHHHQQRKQETQYSRLIVEQPSSSHSHVKYRASSYGTLQKCNCLNSVSAASTSTRANKQAAGNSLYSYSTRKTQSNQWKASTISDEQEQQPHLTSNKVCSKKDKETQSLRTSNRTTESATSSRQLQSLSNHEKVESVTLQQTGQSSFPSKIRSIFHLQKRKRYSYSVSPRKILSSLKKLNFSRDSEFKKKVLQEDIVEDDVKKVAARRFFFTKQIPTSESNHHQREKEKGKWKGRSLLSANCSSESNKSNITVVVETNKLVKRSITVKSSTTISSPSKPTTEKELDCCVVKSLNSNRTGEEASVENANQEQKKYSSCRPHEDEDDDRENGNCSNINNNKRKNSSKNFEKLKKFLLFCKGLRKKSK